MKFLHLSDLHIHTNEKDNQEIAKLLAYISKNYPGHHLIVTGDITDDGKDEQCENAFNLLKPFMGKIFICPGNHDFGAAGNFYSHERALRFDKLLSKRLCQGGTFKGDSTPVVNVVRNSETEVMLIALDSNLETHHPFDFACGEIGEQQLNALDTILTPKMNNGMIRILFFHHHPFMMNDPFMQLKDAEELARVIYGRADVVLFGHKHEIAFFEKRWGAKYMLASDNSPGKNFVREITVSGTDISVTSIDVAQAYS